MASVEPVFDAHKDAWFDLDLAKDQVVLKRCSFEKHGDAGRWLLSPAFDLHSGRSLPYEELVARAAQLLDTPRPNPDEIAITYQELLAALDPKDDFLFRWRYICQQKGLLP
jgi:hypothetical protein